MIVKENTADVYVFLGGTRSGKSLKAEQKAVEIAQGAVLYVATAQHYTDDIAMQKRIAKHAQRRPVTWETMEQNVAVASAVEAWLEQCTMKEKPTVLIDCVTLWVSNILLGMPPFQEASREQEGLELFEQKVTKEIQELLCLTHTYPVQMIFVSGETGLGGVGLSALQRSFHDGLGLANQLLVDHAKQAYFVIAGRCLPL